MKRVLLNGVEHGVENVWWHGDKLVFKFLGVDSISQAESLAGSEVCVPSAERAPLEEGAYFQSDLIGCVLFDRASGCRVGIVTGWQENGGPALLELEGEHGEEILIPFAKSICVHIDVAAKRIEADLPEGLTGLNTA